MYGYSCNVCVYDNKLLIAELKKVACFHNDVIIITTRIGVGKIGWLLCLTIHKLMHMAVRIIMFMIIQLNYFNAVKCIFDFKIPCGLNSSVKTPSTIANVYS